MPEKGGEGGKQSDGGLGSAAPTTFATADRALARNTRWSSRIEQIEKKPKVQKMNENLKIEE